MLSLGIKCGLGNILIAKLSRSCSKSIEDTIQDIMHQTLRGRNLLDEDLQLDQGSTITHVGFNNLKKLPTNKSQASSVETRNTSRLNPLARLFLINKGSDIELSNVNESDILPNNRTSIGGHSSAKERPSRILNFAKKRSKSKMNSNNLELRTESQAQENNGNALQKPKYFGSEEKASKSLASPVSLHHIFHRTHPINATSLSGDSNNRAGQSLSSQNSNSFIRDTRKASQFRFTNPGFLVAVSDNSVEGNSLQELHKKYLVSADTYIPHKAPRVSIDLLRQEDVDVIQENQAHNDGNEAFDSLFSLTLKFFSYDIQGNEPNRKNSSTNDATIESLRQFVEAKIAKAMKHPNGPVIENRHFHQSSQSKSEFWNAATFKYHPEDQRDELIDSSRRELTQHIQNFFKKGFERFKMLIDGHFERRQLDSNKEYHQLELLEELWLKILVSWDQFNLNIRFTFQQIFEPLQDYFDTLTISGDESPYHSDIEKTLMTSFRDRIILPYLQERQLILANATSFDGIFPKEEQFLGSEKVWRRVTNCFGFLASNGCFDYPESKNGRATRVPISHDFMLWLNKIHPF